MPPRSTMWPRRTRGAVCLALAMLAVLPAGAHAAAPANDAFASAQVVQVGDRATGTLVDATLETGEPATSSELIDHTVWYRLNTSTTERVRLDTCGGNPYAELQVFTGASVDALTEAAKGDYGCTSGGRVYLMATAGTPYYVRVSGYEWGAAIALTIARPQKPANDDFANAQVVGLPANVSGTNVDATVEPGEVDPVPYGSGQSVWFRFTPTTNDVVTLKLADCASAGASVSTLSVFRGDSLGSLTEVGQFAQACGFRTWVTLFPKAGTTYRVAVRGGVYTADAFTLSATTEPSTAQGTIGPRPPNPKCPFELAAPGSVTYSGMASGGGQVCITVEPGFTGVSWFNLVNPPRDLCIPFAVEHYVPARAIVARRFSARTGSARVTGTFSGQAASGTFQAAIPEGGAGVCSGRVVSWTATTQATPPPSISDATPPVVRVRGATAQHPLRSGRLTVSVRCPETCAAGASARVAGVYVQSASRTLRPNVARTLTLRLTARARRAIRRSLRARRSFRTRITVVALDTVGNPGRAQRTITVRR